MQRAANHEMVILARQSRGHSQAALAKMLGITPGTMSKIEHGISPLTADRVRDLADHLQYPDSLFYRPERVRGSDSICFHHRKRASMPARLLDRVEAEMHLSQLHVKRILGEVEIESDLEVPTLDPGEYGGPTEVARLVRATWRLPSGPISNMVQLVESAGAVVIIRDFGTRKLDAMSCWAKGVPPIFFLNSAMPTDRLRWSIAHELGHLVMHWTPPASDPEQEADEFARELLLPDHETRPALRTLTFTQLPALKTAWRVSMIALVKAAATRNALPPNKTKSLYVQISRRGWRTEEPYALEPESPATLEAAVTVHLHEHGYSTDELARIVDLHPKEFRATYLPNVPDPEDPKRHLRAV